MIRIAMIAGGQMTDFSAQFDYYVGIDRGSLFLIENGLPLELAIGDFDSVSEEELSNIKERAKECIQAPVEKDDTDTELALKTVFERFPDAQVTLFAAFGGRLDHMMSNIFLPSDPEIAPYMKQIILKDDLNHIHYFPSGHHKVEQVEGMTYVSFMTDGDAPLSIEKAKYQLTSDHYFQKKVYSSNEFVGKPIEVTLDKGYLVVIQSKDRR
ncbi:thiamine diphosphokinase [Streptococcus uberis]|uniref:thiamine diphosphokinase n=1 Tax=Streptococcus uberis TaxID=1349 RepID=UPI001FF64221|nr:thiamine diphosphokinase [Streptococcus uberis]MCK1226506.1 thiamine diphosphokinase [Streptococcus uberis]MCK1230045.1 thiamine diphosphokinase [Streptococcus uberis]